MNWHILTGEYPPMPGGVADYTRIVASGLAAAGDRVVVWTPAGCDGSVVDPGVEIWRLPDHFGRAGRAAMDAGIPAGARVLVQYVPHAFGARSMNVGLAGWLCRRRRRWAIDVMFHEVAMPFGVRQPLSYNIPAAVHRVMARLLVNAADRVFVSTSAWNRLIRPRRGAPIVCPVFSNLPAADPRRVAALRAGFAGRAMIGHFGGCGPRIAEMLTAAIPLILRQRDAVFCFIGRGSSRGGQKLAGLIGQDAAPVVVTDDLSATDAAAHIAACDVMLLPYPDGVTTRRSSTVAALALGTPVVSTVGALTEPLWAESSVVGLADSPASAARMTCEVLDDSAKRADLSRRSRVLYEQSFSVSQTVRRLRGGNREGVQ